MNRKLVFWLAVQPTPYNKYLYDAIKRSISLNVKIFYSFKEFSELPYTEKNYDDDDVFLEKNYRSTLFVLSKSFSRKTVFVFSGWETPFKILLLLIRSVFFLPYIIWTDSINPENYQDKTVSFYLKRFFSNQSKAILTTGNFGIKKFLNAGLLTKHKNIFSLPYYVPVPQDISSPTSKPTETFNLLVLARLIDYKGIDNIIKAVGLLKNPRIHVRIGGIGELENELIALTESLGIEKNVHFLGWLDEAGKIKEFGKCHVLVHCTKKHEPYGVVILEALSHGLPVIGTELVGAVVHRVNHGENGFIVLPDEPTILSKKIELLSKDHQYLIKLSENARKLSSTWSVSDGVKILENTIL